MYANNCRHRSNAAAVGDNNRHHLSPPSRVLRQPHNAGTTQPYAADAVRREFSHVGSGAFSTEHQRYPHWLRSHVVHQHIIHSRPSSQVVQFSQT